MRVVILSPTKFYQALVNITCATGFPCCKGQNLWMSQLILEEDIIL